MNVFWALIQSSSLSVCLFVCSLAHPSINLCTNNGNFVSQTSLTVLLLFFSYFVNTLMMYLSYTKHFSLNPFPNNEFWTLPRSLQMTILNVMKMAESPPKG